MDKTKALKALADETRMKILVLLLKHNYCVRALANELGFSEATISQHLKVLREADLLIGEKRGYFMHYDVKRPVLHELAAEIAALAKIERNTCSQESQSNCSLSQCHKKGKCPDTVQEFCHGKHAHGCGCHGEPHEA